MAATAARGTDVPAGFVDVTAASAAASAPPPSPVAEAVSPVVVGDEAAPVVTEAVAPVVAETAEEGSKAARGKAAADRARAASKKNKQLLEDRARLEQTANYQAQQVQALTAQQQQADAYIRQLQNPATALDALEKMGVTPEQLAQRMAQAGSPEAKMAALQEMVNGYRQELLELRNGLNQKQSTLAQEAEETTYKKEASDSKRYPSLAAIPPDFVLAKTKELLKDIERGAVQKGIIPAGEAGKARGPDGMTPLQRYMRQFTNHDLLSFLDEQYASQPKPAAPPTTKKTTTITNRLATAVHTVPPNFDTLSDREQKKIMAGQLGALLKG